MHVRACDLHKRMGTLVNCEENRSRSTEGKRRERRREGEGEREEEGEAALGAGKRRRPAAGNNQPDGKGRNSEWKGWKTVKGRDREKWTGAKNSEREGQRKVKAPVRSQATRRWGP